VRVAHAPGASRLPASEGVVEDVAGPNEEGTGWNLTVRIGEAGAGDSLVSVAESELEATGLAVDERGERVPLAERPGPDELRDRIEVRLFTELVDGIAAARTAEEVERELAEAVSAAAITIVAERHWSEPYNYEFGITIEPFDDPVEALGEIALLGEGGWISSRDDGWRFDLWWSGGADTDAVFLVPDVHGAEVSFLPWRSPRRRPEDERPLLAVPIRTELDDPGERELDGLDPEPGDEEP
jgi:hypothetical protein